MTRTIHRSILSIPQSGRGGGRNPLLPPPPGKRPGRRMSMFHRFGLRPDVIVPLALATVILPLGLVVPVVHFSWALKDDTTFSVLSGTFDLLKSGHVGIGLLILFFSILFPSAKIVALYALWFAPMAPESTFRPLRWLEFLGKWSMLDVFVVGILVGTLDLGILAETTPRAGAYVFTAAVLLSMVATLRQIRWARPPRANEPTPARPGPIVPALALMAIGLLAAGLTNPLVKVDKWLFWKNEFSVLKGVSDMAGNGYGLMAAIVIIFVVVAPVGQIACAAGWGILGGGRLATAVRIAGRWAMADVFALGIAVVISKIGGVVNVAPRPGLWLFIAGAALGSGLGGWLSAPRSRDFPDPIS